MKKAILIPALLLFVSTGLTAQHHNHNKEALAAGEVHPGHSLYHLQAQWTDHRENKFSLADFKGEPVIIVMFYGKCTEVCPILIQDTWRLYSSIEEPGRNSVKVLAVSFDTENDTPAALKKYAEYEQLNIPGWHFVTSADADTRSLAMMLGVKYARKSDGHFAHSNLITVLDREGNIAARIEGLNQPVDEAAAKITKMLSGEIRQ